MERQCMYGPAERNGQSVSAPMVPRLFGDIIADLRSFVEQRMVLFRQEVRRDLAKLKTAVLLLGVGAGSLTLSTLFLLLALVHALHAASWLPLWACYGVAGGGAAAAAAAALALGKKKLPTIRMKNEG